MRKTKKLTLSAMMVALGTVFMVIGAVFEVMDLTACALASLVVVFIYLELGSPYTWLVWICTTLATALFYPGSVLWAEYFLVFGVYPMIKAYIERLPRWLWLIVKLVYINAIIWALMFVFDFIFGTPLLGSDSLPMTIILYILMNVAFVAYDMFITVMVRLYIEKFRHRFKKFLK